MAAILAGGQSRRFGRDKVFAELNGRTLLDTLCTTLQSIGFDVVISANTPEKFQQSALPVITDALVGEGPLQALYSLLKSLDCDRLLLVPVDMPFLNAELLSLLWEAGREGDIAAFETASVISPLPAVYSNALLADIAGLLQAGRRDLRALFSLCPTTCLIKEARWRPVDASGFGLSNINTQDDLIKAVILSARSSG